MKINYIHPTSILILDFLCFKFKYPIWFILSFTESVSEHKDIYICKI
jgi:hypothetical protein